MKKWLARISVGLLGLIAAVLVVIWAGSEWLLSRNYSVTPREIVIPTDPESIEAGKRLARMYGCFEGCHGKDMQGGDLFDLPDGTQLRSPNLTRLVRERTIPELEAGIRQGVRPDGNSVLAMPSASFATMTDQDLGRILAFIKSYPPQDNHPAGHRIMPMARTFLLLGHFEPEAATRIPGRQPADPATLDEAVPLGRYLALNACAECHGLGLEGREGFTPSLVVARAYSEQDFDALMREGLALGGREVGLMSEIARRRLVNFTDVEIAALYAFLQQADIPLEDVPVD